MIKKEERLNFRDNSIKEISPRSKEISLKAISKWLCLSASQCKFEILISSNSKGKLQDYLIGEEAWSNELSHRLEFDKFVFEHVWRKGK